MKINVFQAKMYVHVLNMYPYTRIFLFLSTVQKITLVDPAHQTSKRPTSAFFFLSLFPASHTLHSFLVLPFPLLSASFVFFVFLLFPPPSTSLCCTEAVISQKPTREERRRERQTDRAESEEEATHEGGERASERAFVRSCVRPFVYSCVRACVRAWCVHANVRLSV